MTTSRVFAAAVAAFLLAACSSNPKPEQAEDSPESAEGTLFSTTRDYSRSSLEIPPDLLQSAGERVQANAAGAAAGPERVLPQVIGASIQTAAGKSWLEIDADAETVWKKLTEFWALQEIDLVEYQPQAGIMATDWFAKKPNRGGNQALSAVALDLLNALVSRRTAVDKFTLRLARDADAAAARTRIFITHRAREKVAQELDDIDKTVEFHWVERDEDPEKVAQLLQTIVLLFDASAGESAEGSAGESNGESNGESTGAAEQSAEQSVDSPVDNPAEPPADKPAAEDAEEPA